MAETLSRFLAGEEALHDSHKLSVVNHFCFPTQDPRGSIQEKKTKQKMEWNLVCHMGEQMYKQQDNHRLTLAHSKIKSSPKSFS